MNYYRHLDKRKFEFNFMVNHTGIYDDEIKKLGGKLYFIPEYKIYNHFKYKKELRKVFLQSDVDIVHVHTNGFSSLILKYAKSLGKVTVSHCHSLSNGKGIIALIKNVIEYFIRFYADYYFACSIEAAEWLYGKKNAKSSKCFIINNAIDTKMFKYSLYNRECIRNKYNIATDEIVIGHVGRLVPVKNHKFSMDLLKSILSEDKKFKMMFCGDGELKEELIRYSKSLGIANNIIFVNSTKDINMYYSAFDCLILPSFHEGLGMTLIEGQFAGVHCFASEGVPLAAKISDNIVYLPLNIDIWKKTILKGLLDRKCNLNENADKYDILSNTVKLQNIYSQML